MGKYVIESKFENTRCFLEVACENREPYFFINRVDSLTPYTEPDLEQVRKEAYEKGKMDAYVEDSKNITVLKEEAEEAYEDGYKTAKVQRNIQAEKDLREVGERHYKKGLSDAWEAARKICTNWVLPDSVLSEIFGMGKTIDDIMKENTASEVIAKIRAYEQEKEEQDGLRQNIQTIVDQCGYTLDEIASVLQKMRES